MKRTFTITAVLSLFGYCVNGQSIQLRSDTSFRIASKQHHFFVKTPVYTTARPQPVEIPNGYSRTTDKSMPMPTQKVNAVPQLHIPIVPRKK